MKEIVYLVNAFIIRKLILNCFYQFLGFACFIFFNNKIKMWNLGRRCHIRARATCSAMVAIVPQLSLTEYLVLNFGTLEFWSKKAAQAWASNVEDSQN